MARRALLLASVLTLIGTTASHALVRCARNRAGEPIGAIRIREACRPSEILVDPVAPGLEGQQGEQGIQGPTGPAGTPAWERPCPPDSIRVAGVCVDIFEATMWNIPSGATALIQGVKDGTATLADLTSGGASQLEAVTSGPCSGSEYPAAFPVTGNWSSVVYAVSVAGVSPGTCASWFQAAQACAASGKRLLANAEWRQYAAASTRDAGGDNGTSDCDTLGAAAVATGSRSSCVSAWGTRDMVGNVWEWVADWHKPGTGLDGDSDGTVLTQFSSIGFRCGR